MTAAPGKHTRGFSVVEVIVGAALVAVIVTAIASAWQFYEKIVGQSVRLAEADLLIDEASEALQYRRDAGWTSRIATLALDTNYYLTWLDTDYIATTTPAAFPGSYVCIFKLSSVRRDASDNIATTGTVDPNTLLATISIAPSLSATSTVIMQAQTLVHNIFKN